MVRLAAGLALATVVGLAGPATGSALADAGFSPPVSYAPGLTSQIVFGVGDFNGDGHPDVAIPTGGVSVLLGDGHGGFGSPTTLSSGGAYTAVAAGDFNNDGKLDLVASAAAATGSVGLFTGDGAGNFTAQTPVTVGSRDLSIAVGDFNRDGNLDVAVPFCGAVCTGGSGSPGVDILLGDGHGGFGSPSALTGIPVTAEPNTVAVGDFNGDGNPDLAVLDETGGNVLIYLGDGHGGFTAGTPVALGGSGEQHLALGDFNGDGRQDLAVSNGGNVSVALGNGSGGFGTPANFALGGTGYGIAVGDFNGDGRPDLAVAIEGSGTGVSVLFGNGDGTFQSHQDLSAGSTPVGVAGPDLNGDDQPDLVVTNNTGSNALAVLLNTRSPSLAFGPSPLAFGSFRTGTAAPALTDQITNGGNGVLKIASATLGGANAGDYSIVADHCSGHRVLVGGSCPVTLGFTPSAPGQRRATLSVATNAPGSPQVLTITGTGVPAQASPMATIATLSGLSETNSVFAVAGTSTPLTGTTAKRHKRGTAFSFQLDQPAMVTVTIQRKLKGRRVGRACKPNSRRLRHKPKCTRLVTAATLARTGHAGLNRISFSGRVNGRALSPARYQAAFLTTDAAGASRPVALSFRIVRR
jgi:hypothetical protein